MTATLGRDRIFVSPSAQRQAGEVSSRLASADGEAEPIVVAGVVLSEDIRALLRQVITIIGEGKTVTVGALPEVLTTTVAADLLGISRTTLMKHVRSGEIASTRAGSHTRLHRDDVLAFRKERLKVQREALEKLIELEDELEIQ